MNLLRHDLSALWVSLLAEMNYCEQKAALSVMHPEAEPESEEMKAGAAAHSVLEAEAEKLEREELRRRIAAGAELRLREFPLKAYIDGVPLYGKIDHVEFEGRRALWLYDFKFSRYSHRLFPNHQLQLSLYGLLLAANDYDVSDLICAVVIVPPKPGKSGRLTRTDPKLANLAITSSKELRDGYGGVRRGGRLFHEAGFAVHAFKFQEQGARDEFADALGYWIGLREARVADSAAKCRSCAYNAAGLCTVAIAPPKRKA
ncbi:MAG: PD-(D/E)XK nuclease family protein [Acidobacteria bacterium]|nr:PD-(D/E)XK nuclease family protein [Acidobacteriota bacterium]MCW5968275.1 PD-(D/E)XK nuclease family protein [Blastocatellales bacterium]